MTDKFDESISVEIFGRIVGAYYDEILKDCNDEGHGLISFGISREDTAFIFSVLGETTKNEDGEEDDSYTLGDVQFNFDGGEISEVLLAPVYEDEESCVNGDFVDAEALFDALKPVAKEIWAS